RPSTTAWASTRTPSSTTASTAPPPSAKAPPSRRSCAEKRFRHQPAAPARAACAGAASWCRRLGGLGLLRRTKGAYKTRPRRFLLLNAFPARGSEDRMFSWWSSDERRLRAVRNLADHLAPLLDLPVSVQTWDGTAVSLGSRGENPFTVALRSPGV